MIGGEWAGEEEGVVKLLLLFFGLPLGVVSVDVGAGVRVGGGGVGMCAAMRFFMSLNVCSCSSC